jgi:hypothetical protein
MEAGKLEEALINIQVEEIDIIMISFEKAFKRLFRSFEKNLNFDVETLFEINSLNHQPQVEEIS